MRFDLMKHSPIVVRRIILSAEDRKVCCVGDDLRGTLSQKSEECNSASCWPTHEDLPTRAYAYLSAIFRGLLAIQRLRMAMPDRIRTRRSVKQVKVTNSSTGKFWHICNTKVQAPGAPGIC